MPSLKKISFFDKASGSRDNAFFRLSAFPLRIVIPVAMAILLFILTIFLFMIPLLEENMMESKRISIMHLTESAWSTLDLFYQKTQNGEMTRAQAMQAAVDHLGQVRYGPALEDYFWINDMTPRMIMHPYRPDLVGKNVAGFKDPSGKRLFSEMVEKVQASGQGFVDYLWQYQGDTGHIVPKISYVKGFSPWGWVVGTGIYVEDVRQEILAITRQLTYTCSGIMLLFLLISATIVWQAVRNEKEKYKALEESRMREKQLIQADKMTSLGILVAGVGHEINNPLSSIILNVPSLKKIWAVFSGVLEGHYTRHPEEKIQNMRYPEIALRIPAMLDAIEDGAGRIKKIISELKEFSRPQEGTPADRMSEDVDIAAVIEKSLDLTRSVLKKATDHLVCDLEPDLPKIKGDTQRLQQVVINLLVNAAQALEKTDQEIHVSARQTPGKNEVEIVVRDTGPGVSPEMLEKLTSPFFTTRRDDGGTGLGLSISDTIVREYGGRMTFETGGGLTVRIFLPHAAAWEETEQ